MKNSLRKRPSTRGSFVLQEIFKRFIWNSLHYPVSYRNLSSTIFLICPSKRILCVFWYLISFHFNALVFDSWHIYEAFRCSVCSNIFYCEMNCAYDEINELTWKRSTHALFWMKAVSNTHSLRMRKIVVGLLLCNLRVQILHALVWTFRVITYGFTCLTYVHLSVNDILLRYLQLKSEL